MFKIYFRGPAEERVVQVWIMIECWQNWIFFVDCSFKTCSSNNQFILRALPKFVKSGSHSD